MAQIFTKSANRIPAIMIIAIILFVLGGVLFFWYYGSPRFTDVGYRPQQPVDYSHKLHAGDMGMDCRYCHFQVEESKHSNIPPTKVCMNCHNIVGTDKESLDLVRESWATGKPIEWVRVHKLPEYSYFDHAAHLNAGVACISCHGNVAMMEEVQQVEKLSMGWCLECHRNPEDNIRPPSQVTNMYWVPPEDHQDWVKEFIDTHNINPPQDCSACHR